MRRRPCCATSTTTIITGSNSSWSEDRRVRAMPWAAVYLSALGNMKQRGDVLSGGSFASSNDPRVHFGLGDATAIDAVEIHWPSGSLQKISSSRRRSHLHRRRGQRNHRFTLRIMQQSEKGRKRSDANRISRLGILLAAWMIFPLFHSKGAAAIRDCFASPELPMPPAPVAIAKSLKNI